MPEQTQNQNKNATSISKHRMQKNKKTHDNILYPLSKKNTTANSSLHNYQQVKQLQDERQNIFNHQPHHQYQPYHNDDYHNGYRPYHKRQKHRMKGNSLTPNPLTEDTRRRSRIVTEPLPHYHSGGDQLFEDHKHNLYNLQNSLTPSPLTKKQSSLHQRKFNSEDRQNNYSPKYKRFIEYSSFLPHIQHRHSKTEQMQNNDGRGYRQEEQEPLKRIIIVEVPESSSRSRRIKKQFSSDSDRELQNILISNDEKLDQVKRQQMNNSRTIQKNRALRSHIATQINQQTMGYLNQCEDIIKNLKGLTDSKINNQSLMAKYKRSQRLSHHHKNKNQSIARRIVTQERTPRYINFDNHPRNKIQLISDHNQPFGHTFTGSIRKNQNQSSKLSPNQHKNTNYNNKQKNKQKQEFFQKQENKGQNFINNYPQQSDIDAKKQSQQLAQEDSRKLAQEDSRKLEQEESRKLEQEESRKLEQEESRKLAERKKQQFMIRYLTKAKTRGQILQNKLLKYTQNKFHPQSQQI